METPQEKPWEPTIDHAEYEWKRGPGCECEDSGVDGTCDLVLPIPAWDYAGVPGQSAVAPEHKPAVCTAVDFDGFSVVRIVKKQRYAKRSEKS